MATSHAPAGDTGTAGTGRSAASTLLAKVPEITALSWVVKVLTTGMGEAASERSSSPWWPTSR